MQRKSMLCHFHRGEIAHNLIHKLYVWNWFYQLLHMIITKLVEKSWVMGLWVSPIIMKSWSSIVEKSWVMRLLHYTYRSHDSFTVTSQNIKNPITICLPYYRKRCKTDYIITFRKPSYRMINRFWIMLGLEEFFVMCKY
jgi:hypothetical protein